MNTIAPSSALSEQDLVDRAVAEGRMYFTVVQALFLKRHYGVVFHDVRPEAPPSKTSTTPANAASTNVQSIVPAQEPARQPTPAPVERSNGRILMTLNEYDYFTSCGINFNDVRPVNLSDQQLNSLQEKLSGNAPVNVWLLPCIHDTAVWLTISIASSSIAYPFTST